MKRSGCLAIALGSILLGSQLILPLAAETMTERSIRQSAAAEELAVDIDSFPALTLLGGSADAVTLTGRNALIGKLLCSDITVSVDKVRIDMARLIRSGKLLFRRVGHAQAHAWITEDDLADALRSSAGPLHGVSVTITPNGIEARGDYALGRSSANVALTGRIVGRDDKICFVSEQVTLQYGAIGKLSAQLGTEVELADLSTLPFAVRITEIRPTDGRIFLAAEKVSTSPQ